MQMGQLKIYSGAVFFCSRSLMGICPISNRYQNVNNAISQITKCSEFVFKALVEIKLHQVGFSSVALHLSTK